MNNIAPANWDHHVRLLKRLLNNKFFFGGGGGLDESNELYDEDTKKLVLELQKDMGNIPRGQEGFVGPRTWRHLRCKTHGDYLVLLRNQKKENTCWHAATEMLLSPESYNRTDVVIDPRVVAPNDSLYLGLNKLRYFLADNNLKCLLVPYKPKIMQLIDLMKAARGPIAIMYASSDYSYGHTVVCSGIHGNNTDKGTLIEIKDPWPPNGGDEKFFFYDDWLNNKQLIWILWKPV